MIPILWKVIWIKKCELKYESQYANAISCSDKKIAEFVSWLQQQTFYENTTIILVGDHINMNSKFINKYFSQNKREVYNVIINSPYENVNKQKMASPFDYFPITLTSIGATIEGKKLGFGTNLFSEEKTLIENLGFHEVNKELLKKSNYYYNFITKEK